MNCHRQFALCRRDSLLAATLALSAPLAHADAVTDWNVRTIDFVVAAGLANQPAHRALAIAHTAAYDAAQMVSKLPGQGGTAMAEAAITAAHCSALSRLLPAQKPAIEASCNTALGALAGADAKNIAIEAGKRAANEVLARRADDGSTAADNYRPYTTAGRYVPTAVPASPHWGGRQPWLMASPSEFRPAPPPPLESERWALDFNEIKKMGGARSSERSAAQTETALYWQTTHPSIYHALVRSVADEPGRDLLRNARLFAAFTQAIDDAMIAVFDAKYHYGFWRPITAIRNAEIDGNDATEPDPSWTPLVSTPMHPEYPCAHCVQAGVTEAVLGAEIGSGPLPQMRTASPAAKGAVRRYTDLGAFAQEVANARIWEGVHYRFSTEAGTEIGRKVGTLAVRRFLGD